MSYHWAVFFHYVEGILIVVPGDVGGDEGVGDGACLVGHEVGTGTEWGVGVGDVAVRDGLQELQVEDVGRTELGIGEVFVYPADMCVEVGTDVCHSAWHAVDGIERTLHRLVHRHFVVCLRQCLLMQQHILA